MEKRSKKDVFCHFLKKEKYLLELVGRVDLFMVLINNW